MNKYEKAKIFLLGVCITLVFGILVAAVTPPAGTLGAYQMQVGADKYVYVLDTATGYVMKIFHTEIPKVENIHR
ncbi:MAG: hypothetical protein KKD56_04065 [Acidobacteria bacterium]|nr:hypothetical protein [Acidobacteriota bacterium]MBU1475426.1 hypothetical protein [Acidobacteriota bacterium]MBU4254402.1 hypothetical protein [Acidobacteriota bacterium]MCG2816060.1 hypothetical protein [Candidatus Aminicenantes bacterium]